MALAFNNDHTVYCHMDALCSVGLAQTYFTHPDSLVVQSWVHITYLLPDTISQTGPQTYCCVKLFEGWVGCMSFGIPCTHILVIIDQINAAIPFVFAAAYLAL